jgi:hypothetical protein
MSATIPSQNKVRSSVSIGNIMRASGNIRRPAAVLVGSADEQVVADQFAPLFQRLDVIIAVTVVPGMTHVDMIYYED